MPARAVVGIPGGVRSGACSLRVAPLISWLSVRYYRLLCLFEFPLPRGCSLGGLSHSCAWCLYMAVNRLDGWSRRPVDLRPWVPCRGAGDAALGRGHLRRRLDHRGPRVPRCPSRLSTSRPAGCIATGTAPPTLLLLPGAIAVQGAGWCFPLRPVAGGRPGHHFPHFLLAPQSRQILAAVVTLPPSARSSGQLRGGAGTCLTGTRSVCAATPGAVTHMVRRFGT